MGLDPGSPGSGPGPKTGSKPLSHSGVPPIPFLYHFYKGKNNKLLISFYFLPKRYTPPFKIQITHCLPQEASQIALIWPEGLLSAPMALTLQLDSKCLRSRVHVRFSPRLSRPQLVRVECS